MELGLIDFNKDIKDMSSIAKFTVSDRIFGCPFNSALIHQVVSSYLINARQGTKSQKSRATVSGSNRKPWRQKGTGRARAGSVKSPIWRSGGVTFAATPKEYNQKVNKKMYRGAIKSILSKLACDNRLLLIENFFIEKPKTKFFLEKLKQINLKSNVLIFNNGLNQNLILASRNLYKIKICDSVQYINPVDLINFGITLIDFSMLKKIEMQLI